MSSASGIRAGRAFVEVFLKDDRLVKGLRRAAARLRGWGDSMKAFGTKLTGIGVAMAAPLTAGVAAFADFEKQMKFVSTMLEEPEKWMPTFSKAIREMSVQFGESTETIARGLYDILSASIPPEKALGVLTAALKAARGGLTDTAVATGTIINFLNAFQLAGEDAADVADLLFSVVKRGVTTFGDLAQYAGAITATAKAAGLSLEEFGAALATATRNGLKTDQAVTGLQRIMLTFLKPSAEGAALARKYGFELSRATLQTEGLLGVLQKLQQMTPEDITKLFPDARGLKAVFALRGDLAGFAKDVQLMSNRAGASEEAFKKMTGGVGGAINKLRQAFVALLSTIGEAIAPMVKDWAAWLGKAAASAREFFERHKGLVQAIARLAATAIIAGAALITLGLTLKMVSFALSGLSVLVTAGKLALGLLAKVLLALVSPAGLVVAAVVAIGAAVLWATGLGARALKWFGECWRTLAADASEAWAGITDALAAGDLALAAKIAWGLLKVEFTRGINWLSQTWRGAVLWLKEKLIDGFYGAVMIVEQIFHGLEVAWIETTAWLAKTWTSFCGGVRKAWDWTGKSLLQTWNKLRGVFDSSFNAESANAAVEQQYQAAKSQLEAEVNARLAQRDQQRQDQRDRAADVHQRTMADLMQSGEREKQALQDEYDRKNAANQAELDAARQELFDARQEARRKREASEAVPEPPAGGGSARRAKLGEIPTPRDIERKFSVAGTFNPAAIRAMWGGPLQDRIARAAEQTAENTADILDELEGAEGLSFAGEGA